MNMDATKEKISTVSRKKAAKLKRLEKKKEKNRTYYEKNCAKLIKQVQNRRREKQKSAELGPQTRRSIKEVEKRNRAKDAREEARVKDLERKKKIREQTKERARKHRAEKKRQAELGHEIPSTSEPSFKNRTSKKRATDKVRQALPGTPIKKAAILKSVIESPRTQKILQTQGLIKTPEEERETTALKALATDISEGLKEVKRSRSNEKRAVLNAFKSLAFGQNVKKSTAKKSLSNLVKLNDKSISKAIKRREKIQKGEIPSWLDTKRKIRRDAITEENAQIIFDYWTNVASRPTGDKKDVMKKRTGKQQYIYHARHVLEKTQTEAYMEFCELHPEIKIKQRKFESLKPFFIKQAKERDRKSCLCRKHVETKIVFTECMKFRKSTNRVTSSDEQSSIPIPKTLTEAVEMSLCPKEEGKDYHNLKCVQRECEECGVEKFQLLPEETSEEGSVRWSRYEYVPTGKYLPDGQEKKKIALVTKETPPSELFKYFNQLLKEYPSHSFMARWQREQLDNLLDNLPQGHVVCIHDYSEGYTCRKQDEIQSEYFDVAKVSLHVTILYRHAVEAVDGIASTDDEPNTIKEHIFVISDDPGQDHDSVHKVQELIHNYLKDDLNYNVVKVHEFTDGCAAQYKSRHCLGDLSCSLADFGFLIQRSYFETSHAKGEQDAAGSHIKQKVSQAVLRRTATISNAESMHAYLEQNFSLPVASTFNSRTKSVQLRRRIFFFVPSSGETAVKRNRPGRQFKTVKGIRKWHCVKSLPQQEKIKVRFRSCYCTSCIMDDEDNCLNKEWLDDWKEVDILRESSVATTRQTTETLALDHDTAAHIADLAAKGSTVAIAAYEDQDYDFYLLKVTSEGVEELEEPLTDDYSCHYPSGSAVLKGHFFLRENITDMTYTLDINRLAVVYAATVRHICSELSVKKRRQTKPIYKLSLAQHEEIISSM